MPKKRYNAEEIIHKLRAADVLLSQGKSISQACKQIGVSDQAYYRWRKIYTRAMGSRPTNAASRCCCFASWPVFR
jgi:transposase-like protein